MQPVDTAINDITVVPLSDRSVLVSFGNIIDPSVNKKVISLHKALLRSAFSGFVESVPAYASLAIFFDVQKVREQVDSGIFDFVKNYILELIPQTGFEPGSTGQIKDIPVCYDPEFGFDLEVVGSNYRLSINEIIELHVSVIYRVYMIGFMPGFAYMGAINKRLITPRKLQPRPQVPAGSVGIAGLQTGIYPIDSPGGWQIIGKTPLLLFDVKRPQPCLLSAGDQVRFYPIDKNEFKHSHVV